MVKLRAPSCVPWRTRLENPVEERETIGALVGKPPESQPGWEPAWDDAQSDPKLPLGCAYAFGPLPSSITAVTTAVHKPRDAIYVS
jgi:hypothetical protein